jgi:NAD(P)-dependent dehydrogenase (short-subunit alcohol dehydrogenase family)
MLSATEVVVQVRSVVLHDGTSASAARATWQSGASGAALAVPRNATAFLAPDQAAVCQGSRRRDFRSTVAHEMTENNRTVFVTRSAQRIGKGILCHFVRAGWTAGFVDCDEEAGLETAAETGAHFYPGDVTTPNLPGEVITHFAGSTSRLDALVNNAGVSHFAPIAQMTPEQFRRVIEVNLIAQYLFSQAAQPLLRDSRGCIVNIASTRALQSEPHGEAYAASKGGVVALTHALAISLGPNVRVNAISPGWIEVGPWQKSSRARPAEHSEPDRLQHPVGRVGTVEDIAELAEFLCSPRSGFITGQNFVVDGGMTKKMLYV